MSSFDPNQMPIRYHYMDAMRSILMMLGIVVHSAQLYNPNSTWVMKAPETDYFFTGLVASISLFRMPVFFMVSGFFCLMTLKKYGYGQFLNLRLRRILLPMLVVACSFNFLQSIILSDYRGTHFSFIDYWSSGEWLGHMWFLLYLSLYFLFAASIAATLFRLRWVTAVATEFMDQLERVSLLIIFSLLGFIAPFVQLLTKFFPFADEFYQLFYWSDVIYYFQFFLFGIVFFARKTLLARFTALSLWLTVPACAGLLVLKMLLLSGAIPIPDKLGKVADFYLMNVAILYAASICFHLFYRFANYGSALFNYLSDAAYSVYLVHHLLVVVLGILVIEFGFGIGIGFITVLLSASLLAIGFHALVLRLPLLRLLFNGK